jgi:hypothetical protein
MHSDRLWDGPRWITNAQREPVWVETKAEYFRLLNSLDKRMKNQQESTTGPEQPKVDTPLPLFLQPTPPPEPISKEEARVLAALIPIRKRHGYREALYCRRCFTRNRDDGCRVLIHDRVVAIECRCGVAEYVPPSGTTDMVISTIANHPVKELERTTATIVRAGVHSVLPAVILNATESTILRAYAKFCHSREYEPRWFCNGCWDGRSLSEDVSVGMQITADAIELLCECRMTYETSKKTH